METYTLTEADNGRTTKVERGSELLVRLEAVLGTGYTWVAAPTDGALEPVGEAEVEATPAGGKVGGPQHLTFRFKAVRPGEANLKFEYRRPWEKDVQPAKSFAVHVVVTQP
jgi:inhibitor of cysteine peptidase